MRIHNEGYEMPEKLDRMNCRTKPKMDDLWECLVQEVTHCPYLIDYGPRRYCVHKDHIAFEDNSARRMEDEIK